MTVSLEEDLDGTSGQLKLSYQLDGTTTTPFLDLDAPEDSPPGFFGSANALFGLTAVGPTGPNTNMVVQDNESIDQTVDLFVDIIFGEEFGLTVRMTSYVSFAFGNLLDDQPLDNYSLFTVSSEFFSTATLIGIEALDASGALIDFELETASGEATFERFSTLGAPPPAVPLPAGMTLMLSSVAALGLMRRRKQARGRRAAL